MCDRMYCLNTCVVFTPRLTVGDHAVDHTPLQTATGSGHGAKKMITKVQDFFSKTISSENNVAFGQILRELTAHNIKSKEEGKVGAYTRTAANEGHGVTLCQQRNNTSQACAVRELRVHEVSTHCD